MIHVIFTGGTIGSTVNVDGSIGTDKTAAYELIELYRKAGGEANLDVSMPINILSENLSSVHVLSIIEEVNDVLDGPDLDGIVITHGTDTLQYTAAILSYVFADSKVPIVMVSANRILSDPKSNGPVNFFFAVRFIMEWHGRGVFVSYCNDGESPMIHRGNRLGNPVVFSDYVYSVRGQFYGRYDCSADNAESWLEASYEPCDNYGVDPDNGEKLFGAKDCRLSSDTAGIMRVNAAPGMVYPHIPEKVRAVLLNSYHSGTICLDERMIAFLGEAHGRDIPVFLLGLSGDAAMYETIRSYDEYGIIPLYDCAPIAQYCKLWLLMSNDQELERMTGCYCEER